MCLLGDDRGFSHRHFALMLGVGFLFWRWDGRGDIPEMSLSSQEIPVHSPVLRAQPWVVAFWGTLS